MVRRSTGARAAPRFNRDTARSSWPPPRSYMVVALRARDRTLGT